MLPKVICYEGSVYSSKESRCVNYVFLQLKKTAWELKYHMSWVELYGGTRQNYVSFFFFHLYCTYKLLDTPKGFSTLSMEEYYLAKLKNKKINTFQNIKCISFHKLAAKTRSISPGRGGWVHWLMFSFFLSLKRTVCKKSCGLLAHVWVSKTRDGKHPCSKEIDLE